MQRNTYKTRQIIIKGISYLTSPSYLITKYHIQTKLNRSLQNKCHTFYKKTTEPNWLLHPPEPNDEPRKKNISFYKTNVSYKFDVILTVHRR